MQQAARSGEILQNAAFCRYSRSLQTADDVEGRVRMLVHLVDKEDREDAHEIQDAVVQTDLFCYVSNVF